MNSVHHLSEQHRWKDGNDNSKVVSNWTKQTNFDFHYAKQHQVSDNQNQISRTISTLSNDAHNSGKDLPKSALIINVDYNDACSIQRRVLANTSSLSGIIPKGDSPYSITWYPQILMLIILYHVIRANSIHVIQRVCGFQPSRDGISPKQSRLMNFVNLRHVIMIPVH